MMIVMMIIRWSEAPPTERGHANSVAAMRRLGRRAADLGVQVITDGIGTPDPNPKHLLDWRF